MAVLISEHSDRDGGFPQDRLYLLLLKDDAVDVWGQREIIWMRSEEWASSVDMRNTRGTVIEILVRREASASEYTGLRLRASKQNGNNGFVSRPCSGQVVRK